MISDKAIEAAARAICGERYRGVDDLSARYRSFSNDDLRMAREAVAAAIATLNLDGYVIAHNSLVNTEPPPALSLHEGGFVSMTGKSLSVEMQRHLLGDTVIGPLGDLTGDIYDLHEAAEAAGDDQASAILLYVHDRICRARHEIAGDDQRPLPPRPAFALIAEERQS